MRKKILSCLLFCLPALFAASQGSDNNEPKIVPPSPGIAELGRYGLANANLTDGAFTTQIPVYQFKTKNLTVPITLSYSTNGLQVNKVASRVGMDWSLMVGGSIGKMVLGGPDDGVSWASYPSDWPSTTGTGLTSFLSNVVNGTVETAPDIYNFNFNGYSGRFLYINNQVIKLEQNSLNIVKNLNSFEVTDNSGTKYIFNDTEESQSTSDCMDGPYGAAGWMKNAWLLSKIIHPLGDTIFFKYKQVTYSYTSGESQTYTSAVESSDGSGACTCPDRTASVKCKSTIQNHGLLLDKIYSNYRGLVQFRYMERQDLTGDSAILGIQVYDATVNSLGTTVTYFNTAPVKNFWFEYYVSTGISGPIVTNNSKRIFLGLFQDCEVSSGICKTYSFNYNKLDSLPKRLSYSQDHYGYFNGKNNNSLIPAPVNTVHYNRLVTYGFGDRRPDADYAQRGCLSKITYPTGGTDSIVYESHSVYHSGGSFNCTNLNVQKSAEADGNSQLKKVHKYYSDIFTINCPQTVSLQVGNVTLSGTLDYPIHEYYVAACFVNAGDDEIGPSTTCVISGDDLGHDLSAAPNEWKSYNVALPAGTYRLMVQVQGPTRGHANFTFFDSEDNSGNINISGVRVKKIMTKDNPDAIALEHKYYYSAPGSTHSSGYATVENPVYSSPLLNTLSCAWGTGGCTPKGCYYTQYSSDNFYSLYTYGGNHIYYTTVTEDQGNNFANGYIEHNFIIAHDAAATPLLGTMAKGTPLSNYGILNGFEYLTRYFRNTDTGFALVKTVRNNRTNDSRLNTDNIFYSFKADGGYANGCLPAGNTLPEVLNLHVASYYLMGRWLYVDSTITTDYDDHGGQMTSISVNTYANTIHQQPTKTQTFDSKGVSLSTENIYPLDSYTYSDGTANTAKSSLESLHMYANPLVVKSYRGTTLLTTTENNFSNAFFSVPVLSKVYKAQFANTKELRSEISAYGNGGTVLETKANNFNVTSYIWDYKNMLPIAQVTGTGSNEIGYTSFEADGKGNWSFSGSATDDATAPTGRKVYNLVGGNVTKSLNSSTTYFVSYWRPTSSGSLTITGTQSGYPVAGLSANGWTLYLHKITGQTTVTVSGTGLIDELRVYPTNAQMTTLTYDPLIGMTSQCDMNGHITYYEYDEAGRLKLVRDQNRYILKKYCYNFAGEQQQCGVDITPDWQNTATAIRCKTVSGNNTGEREREQRDSNPYSLTYNGTRWVVVDVNCSTCPKPANWVTTGTTRCAKDGNNDNTGAQERQEIDQESCSATYNQTRWVFNGYNYTSCPLPCSTGNCLAPNHKCVSGTCETGTRYNKSTFRINIGGTWYWRCTYYYCFSDGSVSADQTEDNGSACSPISNCLL
jgi:hypothetical protein